jgi:hypothetical protein
MIPNEETYRFNMTEPDDIKQVEKGKKGGFCKTK